MTITTFLVMLWVTEQNQRVESVPRNKVIERKQVEESRVTPHLKKYV